ncbi:hypothetical protein [Streptomyces afghaniensis 772] [Streptomyces afghaniensis]
MVGSEHYPAVFLGFALANLPLLLCLKGVRNDAPVPAGDDANGGAVLRRSLASVLAVLRLTLYVLHVGIEAGLGGSEPTHLETVGYGAGVAATATSVYWLMMTVAASWSRRSRCVSPPRRSSSSPARV